MSKTVEVDKVHPGVMVALLTSSMLILMGGAAVTPDSRASRLISQNRHNLLHS